LFTTTANLTYSKRTANIGLRDSRCGFIGSWRLEVGSLNLISDFAFVMKERRSISLIDQMAAKLKFGNDRLASGILITIFPLTVPMFVFPGKGRNFKVPANIDLK
jgi:hypothetical protein